MMKKIQNHGPIFLMLQVLTFISFGRIMDTPIWQGVDAAILCDAHILSQDPQAMLGHLGFYFSQPLLQLAFLLEYMVFGLEPVGYIAVNLFIHAFNAFIVFMLVNMLFPRKSMAILAAVLFAFGVGSYGKIFMAVSQLEFLMLSCLHMMTLYCFIRNDFRHGGRIISKYFLLGLLLFLLSGLTRATLFSLILSLAAYKLFFNPWNRGRVLISRDLLTVLLVGIVFSICRAKWGYRHPTVFGAPEAQPYFSLMSIKNMFRYLTLMFFPMQKSPILETAPTWLVFLFKARTVIRVFITLSIISYSFFGFIFGSKAIRFFIAWTFISVLPFTGQSATGNWLNLSHLYLTSVGFCIILAAGAEGTSALLKSGRRSRFIPYLAPLAFVAMSLGLTFQLDKSNLTKAASPEAGELRAEIDQFCR